jgi:hypothetical protein
VAALVMRGSWWCDGECDGVLDAATHERVALANTALVEIGAAVDA